MNLVTTMLLGLGTGLALHRPLSWLIGTSWVSLFAVALIVGCAVAIAQQSWGDS